MTFNLYWSSSIFFPHPNAKIKKVINNPNFLIRQYGRLWFRKDLTSYSSFLLEYSYSSLTENIST